MFSADVGELDQSYEKLKEAILERYQENFTGLLKELFSTEESRDKKPLNMVRTKKKILEHKYSSFDSHFFCMHYYQRLPDFIQRGLVTVKDRLDLEELAKHGDKMMSYNPTFNVCYSDAQPHGHTIKDLVNMINEMSLRLQSLEEKVITDTRRSCTTSRCSSVSSYRRLVWFCYAKYRAKT
ncbi:unnamed protein product [Lepeophtheirus salmonis]|uniref:(salmon louse) hypothetical protein n=1 Tax=Lepeophtheirus salmonis TaxID=72036 RepID=A0A7R8CVX3_LEPSM|nr:unnamed protein product [Lepeophtheirus salmonis]CAF2948605.1 unnamed protein product [Lepeophtheirus salmonis]